jgi:hypothetical protein
MEYREELELSIGEENLKILITEIKHGKVSMEQLKAIALRMCGDVHGVFVHSERDMDPHYLCGKMLDSWYNAELCDPNIDGLEMLKDVLTAPEVGLN